MSVIERCKIWYVNVLRCWTYCSKMVWHDTRHTFSVNIIKTINLSVRSFFDSDIQTLARAMTYRTILAIVPALALLFAIGRGFGLQRVLENELMSVFPAQRQAVEFAINYVDAYLNASSEGVFLGIGLVFLLWTLISMMSSLESTFNKIWGIKNGRGLGRKITDYTAMLLILPIVLICASGLTLMVGSTLRSMFSLSMFSPMITWAIKLLSWLLTCLFFTLLYVLLPNTKVKIINAIIPGIVAGTGFMLLQWLFVSGQMYVARYNAIYGSISFLPLLLIWMQLVYVIIFAGAVVCYSSQNIFMYSFNDAIAKMSSSYFARLTIAIGAVVTQRFINNQGATTVKHMVQKYNLPPKLVSTICDKMVTARIFSITEIDPKSELRGYQPAVDPSQLTIAYLFDKLNLTGTADFIPEFDKNFPGVIDVYKNILDNEVRLTSNIKLTELKVNN